MKKAIEKKSYVFKECIINVDLSNVTQTSLKRHSFENLNKKIFSSEEKEMKECMYSEIEKIVLNNYCKNIDVYLKEFNHFDKEKNDFKIISFNYDNFFNKFIEALKKN